MILTAPTASIAGSVVGGDGISQRGPFFEARSGNFPYTLKTDPHNKAGKGPS